MGVGFPNLVFFQDGRGPVYSVPRDVSHWVIRLPDGRLVTLGWGDYARSYVSRLLNFTRAENEAGCFVCVRAYVEIAPGEGPGVFSGDWKPLLRKIEAASAVNSLYSVRLTEEEYERLVSGGFEELKTDVTPRAASFLHLYKAGECEDVPSLQLFRVDRCPR